MRFATHAAYKVGAQVPVHGRDNVVGAEGKACAHTDRFMAPLAKSTAKTTTFFPQRDHILVEDARQAHPVIQFKSLLTCQHHPHPPLP